MGNFKNFNHITHRGGVKAKYTAAFSVSFLLVLLNLRLEALVYLTPLLDLTVIQCYASWQHTNDCLAGYLYLVSIR